MHPDVMAVVLENPQSFSTVHGFEQARHIRLTPNPNQREKLNDQTSALRIFGVFHNMAVRPANAAKISALMNATQHHS
jgi:hypothetical protein